MAPLLIKNKNSSSKMVKTAFFGHFGEKNVFHLIFFMFQNQTFTFLIIKIIAPKWSKLKTAFFGSEMAKKGSFDHFGAKIFIFYY